MKTIIDCYRYNTNGLNGEFLKHSAPLLNINVLRSSMTNY